ncbi:MAG: hypothetical protein WAL75_08450 [Terracidiphilus sp.]
MKRLLFDFRAPHPRRVFAFAPKVGGTVSIALMLGLFVALCQLRAFAQADSQWSADQSTLSYHMSHPMHEVDGVSHAARGKGVCHAGSCDFLIAVPVKSFDSGDTNRDLHMIEATRGAAFPLIQVRAHFPQAEIAQQWIHADLEVQFAGQTAHYSQVPFERTQQGSAVRIVGTIPLTCSDFKIDRPSFLTVPIKNEIPVRVDMLWHAM